jgi:hypothetical protein
VSLLSSLHNYTFILYNNKLRDTRAKIETRLGENEIINQFRKENITAEEVQGFKTTISSF